MITETANDILQGFQKALSILDVWSQKASAYVWFRGVSSREYSLLPAAYRQGEYNEFEPILDLCQQGVKFFNDADFDKWRTYYYAQHHGIPTRLLDWTESYIAAVFFAVDDAQKEQIPCVWLLQPHLLNKFTVNWNAILSPEINSAFRIWLPRGILKHETLEVEKEIFSDGTNAKYDNQWPVAIFPRQEDVRIQVQQGFFTVHGRENISLEKIIFENCQEPDRAIARIDFVDADLKRMKEQLQLLGVRRSSVYPDIQNYVRDLKEEYGW